MIKIISGSTPSPPMPVPGVHANSVHSCNAGNANGRLNRGLESRAWLESVPCLAPWNIPWNMYSCANGRRLVFHADLVEHCLDVRYGLMPCLELTLLVYI
jgi:hypothetical protein